MGEECHRQSGPIPNQEVSKFWKDVTINCYRIETNWLIALLGPPPLHIVWVLPAAKKTGLKLFVESAIQGAPNLLAILS